MKALARSVACSAFAIAFASATNAHADGPSSAAAERLFREATEAQEKGNYAEACAKLAESNRIERALGTEYNLAACYELTHRSASARAAYLGAADLAAAAGKATVARDAHSRADKLDKIVPRVVLRLAPSAANARVAFDDVLLAPERVAAPIEADPGTHRIQATADGRAPFEATIDLSEGQRTEIVIALGGERAPVTAPPAEPETGRSSLAYVGLAGAGVGVLALGAAGIFALRANGARNDSGCIDGRICPDDTAAGRLRDAKDSADLATIFVIAGGALVAAGGTLFLFAPASRSSGTASIALAPALGGAAIRGRF